MSTFIELPDNNMFVNGRLETLPDGPQMLFRDRYSVEPQEGDEYHTVKQGETLDLIAYVRYSKKVEDSSKYWWLISDANNIPNPLDLSAYVGTNILIPNVTRVKSEL